MQVKDEGILTPRKIVEELDRYIIGQKEAKKAVAIALRNRWRRQRVEPELRDEIMPKNIIMIGPTGVGKTEIARRLARLTRAPFIKVEASKFTEVGYVGRDVDSVIRDLVDVAISMVKSEETERLKASARERAEEKLLDLLLPPPHPPIAGEPDPAEEEQYRRHREKMRSMLRSGALDHRTVEIDVPDSSVPFIELFTPAGMEEMGINFKEMFGGFGRTKRRRVSVPEAMEILEKQEAEAMIDMDSVIEEAKRRVENHGIVFLDEIDKIAGREGTRGPDVSREGVQRDLLPIIEGSTVMTKHGPVRTDHILFIAAGAFHVAKPSDLIPELQGRFPIRVELHSLGVDDFVRILTEPRNALIRQYQALMATEGVTVEFTEDAIRRISEIAYELNQSLENIGARRLHTVLEMLMEEISFTAPERAGESITIDAAYVDEKLGPIMEKEDLSRYIL